jgi:hypothetical protein
MARVASFAVRAAIPLAACGLVAALVGVARAADKPQLGGHWNYNQDQSDDAREKVRDAQEKSARARRDSGGGYPNGGTYPGGGYPGGGYPGGGIGVGIGRGGIGGPMGGGIGRRGGMGNQGGGVSSRVWDELAANPRFLRIDQRENQIVINDDADHARTFYPDGKKHEEKDANGKKTSTKTEWDGDALIAESKQGHSGKLTETYRLTPDGRQLYVVSRFEDPSLAGSLSIRRVYDLASAPAR